MYKEILFVCVVLLKGVPAQNATVDTCDANAFLSKAQQKCLDLYGIPMTLPDPRSSSYALITIMFPTDSNTTDAICRPELRENYTKAALCVYAMINDCVKRYQLFQVFVPAPENVKRLVKQTCEGSGDYNQTCAVDRLLKLMQCVNSQNKNVSEGNFGQCMIVQTLRECTRQELQPCGAATVQMHVENVLVPDTCKNDTVTRCDLQTFLSESLKCLDIHDVPITFSMMEVLDMSPKGILTLMSQIDDNNTDIICRPENRENYIRAANCYYSLMRTCAAAAGSNPIHQIFIPNTKNLRRLITEECDAVREFDQRCAFGKIEEIVDCVNVTYRGDNTTSRYREDNSTNDGNLSCLMVQITLECTRLKLQSCGVATVKMYEENLPVSEICKKDTDLPLDCISRATDSACDDKEPRVTSRRNIDQICGDAKTHNNCLKDAVLKRCGDVTASEYGDDLASKLPQMCRDSDATTTDNSAQTSIVSVYAMLLCALLLY